MIRKIIVVITLAIPLLFAIRAFRHLDEWYFYIPLGFFMFTNFLALTKIWMLDKNELTREDFKVSLQTGTILVLAAIATSVFK